MSWTTHQLKTGGWSRLTREIWRRVGERKTIKSKILNTKSKGIQDHLQKEYSSKDKEIKRSARQDKRAYVDKLAEKAETAAQKGELSTVYRITKQLCRHIIEQSTEWNTPLCISFIDVKKAFDSIHHETLWKILRHYGLPQKIVGVISVLYKSFECSVLMDSTQTNYFPVKSGVCQGCIHHQYCSI